MLFAKYPNAFYSLLFLTLVACFLFFSGCRAQNELHYPETDKLLKAKNYHGEEIIDPYSWLDNPNDSLVLQWAKQQDSLMGYFCRNTIYYEGIKERLGNLTKVTGRMELPSYSKDHIFYLKDDAEGIWNLFRRTIATSDIEILPLPFNPRAAYFFIPNLQGTHLALALASPGGYFDWKIYDVEKKVLLEETLRGSLMNNTRLSWSADGKSCFYLASEKEDKESEPRTNLSIKKHTISTPGETDILVYKAASEGSKLQIDLCKGGENLIVTERQGASTAADVFYFDLDKRGFEPSYLVRDDKASYVYIGNQAYDFYFETDKDAPRGKIVSININKGKWKDVVAQSEENIMAYQSAGGSILPIMTADQILIVYQDQLKLELRAYDFHGKHKYTTDLTSGGLYFNTNGMNAMSSNQFQNEALFRFIGITEPNTIFKLNTATGKIAAFDRANVSFNADNYISEIVFCKSKDGTDVPISLTYKKNTKLDGNNYLLLQVYGAIGFTNYPYFQGDYISWLEMGGIHAVAHVRGGGAFGDDWHKQGIGRNKQNGIDDYLAAINYLTELGYSQADRIVLNGTSAGTIPVAAILTQAPHKIGAAVLHYGMLDMLGYAEKYADNAGHAYMIPEIGDIANDEDYAAIKSYSPYQKISNEISYPPTLALTSDMDIPMNTESYKWIAKMQANKKTNSAQLLQMAWGSRHSGFGSMNHSPVTTFSDEISFLIKVLGIQLDHDYRFIK